MTFSVESSLDAHIEQTEKPRPPDGLWHPSSLFSCARQAVYEVRGVPASDERDARSRRILRLGTSVHDIVQGALIHASGALATYNEVSVKVPLLDVTGSADTLLQHTEDEYELLEFKSISARGLQYGDLPKAEHVKQARTYVYGLRRFGGIAHAPACGKLPGSSYCAEFCTVLPPLGDKLRAIRIAYFSRDDLRIEEFPLMHSPEWDRELEQYVAGLGVYRNGNGLPERLPLEKGGKRNWLCKDYCLYRTRCWNQDGELHQVGE